jgi:hypothetical protein
MNDAAKMTVFIGFPLRFALPTTNVGQRKDGCLVTKGCRRDWLVDGAVRCELVSVVKFPDHLIENGFVHLPKEAPWLTEYIHELLTFPNSKFDDQVDATSQALDWIKRHSRTDGVWMYIDKHSTLDAYQAGDSAEAIAERLRIPPGRVKMWIAEKQQNQPQSGLAALEQLKEQLRQFCPACGKEIVGDYRPVRGRNYHPRCV